MNRHPREGRERQRAPLELRRWAGRRPIPARALRIQRSGPDWSA